MNIIANNIKHTNNVSDKTMNKYSSISRSRPKLWPSHTAAAAEGRPAMKYIKVAVDGIVKMILVSFIIQWITLCGCNRFKTERDSTEI